jgi:hypothetical protein
MFLHLFSEVPLLFLLQAGFTVWMLVDCYRRGADTFWFFIILFFPALGPLVYFFVVKVHDFRGWSGPGFLSFQRRPSMEEVRYQVANAPTLANRLLLAELLIAQGEHAEAVEYLEAILPQEPDHCQTLYLLAVCRMELGHPELAVPALEKVIARDRQWSNYRAWYLLRKARAEAGDPEGAVQTCRELVRNSPTLEHKCSLAEQLSEAGQFEQALEVLDAALEEYRFAPSAIRRRNSRWASQARRLQKRIGQQSSAAQLPSNKARPLS